MICPTKDEVDVKNYGRNFADVMLEESDKMFGVNMTPNEYMLDWEQRHGGWDE